MIGEWARDGVICFYVEFWCLSYVTNMLSKEQVVCVKWCHAGKKENKVEITWISISYLYVRVTIIHYELNAKESGTRTNRGF